MRSLGDRIKALVRNTPLVTGEYYHIYNRGINSGLVFLDDHDRERFYESLFLFNDQTYKRERGDRLEDEVSLAMAADQRGQKRGNPFVTILGFCLMSNHYHLLLRQDVDGGVSKFMHKVVMGYAKYANLRYKRTGALFEGPFESVLLENEAHYMHLIPYIHLNALDATGIDWRQGLVDDWDRAEGYLDAYKWSSHHVYRQAGQLLPVVDEEEARNIFPNRQEYIDYLRDWAERSNAVTK